MNNWPLKVVTVWEEILKLRGDIPPPPSPLPPPPKALKKSLLTISYLIWYKAGLGERGTGFYLSFVQCCSVWAT